MVRRGYSRIQIQLATSPETVQAAIRQSNWTDIPIVLLTKEAHVSMFNELNNGSHTVITEDDLWTMLPDSIRNRCVPQCRYQRLQCCVRQLPWCRVRHPSTVSILSPSMALCARRFTDPYSSSLILAEVARGGVAHICTVPVS